MIQRLWKPIPMTVIALAVILLYTALIGAQQRFYWLDRRDTLVIFSFLPLCIAPLMIVVSVIVYVFAGKRTLVKSLVLDFFMVVGVGAPLITVFGGGPSLLTHQDTLALNGHVYHLAVDYYLATCDLKVGECPYTAEVYECDGSGLWCAQVAAGIQVPTSSRLRAGDSVVEVVDENGVALWTATP